MKKLITVILALVMLASLAACGGQAPKSTPTPIPTPTPNPIQALAKTDKEMYDMVLKVSEKFKDPSSARITEIGIADKYFFTVRLSGVNSLGGTVKEDYYLNNEKELGTDKMFDGWVENGYDEELRYLFGYDFDIGAINKALKYYWEELGL
ncbi:MAG: hypothetical protein LBS90_06460 [Oscillospiraceae bacterium]|nr:hypothetical protein [Oscillospiraceae bacterium]